MAPRTVRYIHPTLRTALGVAFRWEMVEPVRAVRAEVTLFRPVEVTTILEATAEDWLSAFLSVALAVGLRPSEALGLLRQDVDFVGARIFVRHTLHTGRPASGAKAIGVSSAKLDRRRTWPTGQEQRQLQTPASVA